MDNQENESIELEFSRYTRGLLGLMEDSLVDLLINQRIGDCTLKRSLGSGGMGFVFEASQQLGDTSEGNRDREGRRATRPVAVKLLKETASAEAMHRFAQEAKILGRLSNGGIAQLYRTGVHRPTEKGAIPYLVMELVPNAKPIDALLGTPQERVRVFAKVCRALGVAHCNGIIHRDLKPANLLVFEESPAKGSSKAVWRAKVIDFGIAHAAGQDSPLRALQSEPQAGTLQYASPEQLRDGLDRLTTASDVYSLGTILVECLTGQPLFDLRCCSYDEARQRILSGKSLQLTDRSERLPRDLRCIVAIS